MPEQTFYAFLCLYKVSVDFMSIIQDLLPEVSPSQICHIIIGPILNGYGATDI
jgi:hypothetical protein